MPEQNADLFDQLDGFHLTKSEYDWLEQRFSNMTEKEKLLFRGGMELERPQSVSHVMLIASQLDHFDLIYGAGDDAALGRFIMDRENTPEATRPFLDSERVGNAYRQAHRGTFHGGHFIQSGQLTDPFMAEDPAPLPTTGDYAIRVKLASRNKMDGVWVGFPDTGEYMDAAHPDELLLGLDALKAETLGECIVLEVDCCLPQLEDIPSQYDSAGELVRHAIDFGYAWAERGQGEPRWLDKWQAVMELEDCHRLDYALDLAQNLRHYAFFPRDVDLPAYGREMAVRNRLIPSHGVLTDAFDGAAYAEDQMGRYGLSATDHGYVAWNGGEIHYDYSQPPNSLTISM